MPGIIIYLFIFSLLTSYPCLADLPLKIKALLEKEKFRLELGLEFDNANKNKDYFTLDQRGYSASIPRQNDEVIVSVLGVRYGITSKTEIYTQLTGIARIYSVQNDVEDISPYQWNDMVFGINHRFTKADDELIFLSFVEISIVENVESKIVYGKKGTIGFTMYDSIDPIAPSLTVAYHYVGNEDINGSKVDLGDSFSINPSLGFVINNEITVTGNVKFEFTGKGDIDSSMRTSQTNLGFGVCYQASEDLILDFNILADISGDNGAHTDLSLLYQL